MNDVEEDTRISLSAELPSGLAEKNTDCLIVVYTREPGMLGKRFALVESPTRVGRVSDNHVVLDTDSVSRYHARFERRGSAWFVADEGSTNGTYLDDELVAREAPLQSGSQIKVGSTILKFLSGADVESQYHEEIYRMTILDGLTQVHNRRYLDEALDREFARARRHGRSFGVIMMDIDLFKQVNDAHGHLAGDVVLRDVAQIGQKRMRRDDVFGRWGGEEFVAILPEATLKGALEVAEALRRKVGEHAFTYRDEIIRVTLSAGVALFDEGDGDPNDLLRRADERLYAAKSDGRDRVCS
jgi:two-component system, cell cycle response regulator